MILTESQKAANKEINRQGELVRFRKMCAEHCEGEINGRLISLIATGQFIEIQHSVTHTRFYQNLTDAAPFMALYDVKNARLCNAYDGEGSHRVHSVANVAFQTLFVMLPCVDRSVLGIMLRLCCGLERLSESPQGLERNVRTAAPVA